MSIEESRCRQESAGELVESREVVYGSAHVPAEPARAERRGPPSPARHAKAPTDARQSPPDVPGPQAPILACWQRQGRRWHELYDQLH
jgi:hypothetical protein